MKTLLMTMMAALALQAAPPNPVAWKIVDAPAKVKPGARFAVKLQANIDQSWHLYSMKQVAEGPIATRIWLPADQPFHLTGTVKAPEPDIVQDPTFNMEIGLYEGEQVFTLPLEVPATAQSTTQHLKVSASYQTCNNKSCLPPRTITVEVPIEVRK